MRANNLPLAGSRSIGVEAQPASCYTRNAAKDLPFGQGRLRVSISMTFLVFLPRATPAAIVVSVLSHAGVNPSISTKTTVRRVVSAVDI
jgi:hypothetical protein